MQRTSRRGIGAVLVVALTVAASGCTARQHRGGFTCDREWGNGTIIGTSLGAAVGGGIGGGIVATSGETKRQAEDYALGIGLGVLTGAAIGLLFGHCAFDPPREEPPPPPPPPAAPAPPVKKRIVLRGVNFDFDRATIRPDAEVILEEAAAILKDEPGIDVSVEGHTDDIGTDAYNQRLSERRAEAVVRALERLGVSGRRLAPRGYGESRPVASNATEEGRAQNRRVELNVISGP